MNTMAVLVPGGTSLPLLWTFYTAMGGLAAVLAALWFASSGTRVARAVSGTLSLSPMAQIGLLALAVRREGMGPAGAFRAEHLPDVGLYTVVLAPLVVTLLAVAAVALHAGAASGWLLPPGAVVFEGKMLDVPPEARRLYALREAARSNVGFFIAVALLTLLALDVHASWAAGALGTLATAAWLMPVLIGRVFQARLAAYERHEADPVLLRQARAASGSLGVPLEAALVDEGPEGHLRAFLQLHRGALTISRRLLARRARRNAISSSGGPWSSRRTARAVRPSAGGTSPRSCAPWRACYG
jgi:hypothetical protein